MLLSEALMRRLGGNFKEEDLELTPLRGWVKICFLQKKSLNAKGPLGTDSLGGQHSP